MSLEPVYEVTSTSNGGGRDGQVFSESGRIDLDLRPPKEMGGSGEGSNPEELFSAGYAACFLGALQATARADKFPLPKDATVSVTIGIGKVGEGFGLGAKIKATLPGVDKAKAEELIEAAHNFCPYSLATRGNIDHELSVEV